MNVRSAVRSVLDTALDRTIVAGYTRIGYRLRESGWADDPQPGALNGRSALVTGANRGIGKAIAAGLARLSATVLLTVRNRENGERTREQILAADSPDYPADVRVEVCDVSDLDAVRAFAADLTGRAPTLDGNRFVIAAAYAGSRVNPTWWLNLRDHPDAVIQVNNETVPVRAELAPAEEREDLWRRLVAMYPYFTDYQQRTRREIPVVILTPSGAPEK